MLNKKYLLIYIFLFKAWSPKMTRLTQICLGVFDHFVRSNLKGSEGIEATCMECVKSMKNCFKMKEILDSNVL